MAPFRSIAVTLTTFVGTPLSSPTRKVYKQDCLPSLVQLPSFLRHNHGANEHTLKLNARSIPSPLTSSSGLGPEAIAMMSLLALQFGLQPSLTRKFTPKKINRSTVVFAQDIVKFIMASVAIHVTKGWNQAIEGWNVAKWLKVAGVPAVLYCIQNFATLVAYQNLSPLTFNVLNQTKTLSAALCCYLLMGRVQSYLQMVSLLILFGSACIIEKIIPLQFWKKNQKVMEGISAQTETNDQDVSKDNHTQGIFAVLLASFLSGLAGAFSQKNLQSTVGNSVGRNSYFFTMELCIVSLIFMGFSMIRSEDGKRIRTEGFFHNWTPQTLIPITTNAAGGIVVGLVTKYAGSVRKGFALIFGLLLSGILQALIEKDSKISVEHVVGGCMAGLSLWMHSAFPAT